MERTNIYITKRQKEFLKTYAEKLQIKPAELLRRIMDDHINKTEEEELKRKIINKEISNE